MNIDLFQYKRRETSTVHIGAIDMGSEYPVRVQSMTTTNTNDTEACVKQAEEIIKAGGELVRLTTQGTREAENLKPINAQLRADGYTTPLVADVHFNPNVADVAALYAEKVRINPGNYVDPARKFIKQEYTDEEYAAELKKIEDRLIPFLNICKANHTAVRIGVNHGSLSDRIRNRYGDTPEGIVESCMEFLRIFKREKFDNVVISIKASNTIIMVRSVRLLVEAMDKEGMNYPLHLGVTEAGEGEDGRIKSAVGIGALLADGIGDTIRVSLSEEPAAEIPVARHLVDYINRRQGHLLVPGTQAKAFNWLRPERRFTRAVAGIGGSNAPIVIASSLSGNKQEADYIYAGQELKERREGQKYIVDYDVVVCMSNHQNRLAEQRALVHEMWENGVFNPVVFAQMYRHTAAEKSDFQLEAAADMGALMVDGLTDGLWLMNDGDIPQSIITDTAFGILQAARLRTSKTEYISCPGCGRTLYDLRETIARIREATKDMKGLKIGIMGCIVNGPGEMADADYGYVGAGVNRVSLYRKQVCVEKNIPQEVAVEHLLELIRKDRES